MKGHPEYLSLIVRAADSMLDGRDRERLDRHVATCAGCREALAAQQGVRTVLVNRPSATAPLDFQQRVQSAIRAAAPDPDFRRWSWRLLPVAAALAIGAFGVARQTRVVTVTPTAVERTADSTATVSSSLWSDSMSDTSVLSLMLHASADDSLADHLKDKQP